MSNTPMGMLFSFPYPSRSVFFFVYLKHKLSIFLKHKLGIFLLFQYTNGSLNFLRVSIHQGILFVSLKYTVDNIFKPWAAPPMQNIKSDPRSRYTMFKAKLLCSNVHFRGIFTYVKQSFKVIATWYLLYFSSWRWLYFRTLRNALVTYMSVQTNAHH